MKSVTVKNVKICAGCLSEIIQLIFFCTRGHVCFGAARLIS